MVSEVSQVQNTNTVRFHLHRCLGKSYSQKEWWLPGAGARGNGSYSLTGIAFVFARGKKALWMNGGDACTTTWMYNKVTTHLNIVKVTFMCILHIFLIGGRNTLQHYIILPLCLVNFLLMYKIYSEKHTEDTKLTKYKCGVPTNTSAQRTSLPDHCKAL